MKFALILAFLAATGCATPLAQRPPDFFANLSTLCGKAFEGRMVEGTEPGARRFDPWRLFDLGPVTF